MQVGVSEQGWLGGPGLPSSRADASEPYASGNRGKAK